MHMVQNHFAWSGGGHKHQIPKCMMRSSLSVTYTPKCGWISEAKCLNSGIPFKPFYLSILFTKEH